MRRVLSKIVVTAAAFGVVLAVLAGGTASAPALAAPAPHHPVAAGVPLTGINNPCKQNRVFWKANQRTFRWGTAWAYRPVYCYIQAALLCRPNDGGKDRWRWGGWYSRLNYWSKVNCFAGYSACKGNINISRNKGKTTTWYATAYLWDICKNAKVPAGHRLKLAAASPPASHPAVADRRNCTRPYRWGDGINRNGYPFAAAEWTGDPNHCYTDMQTRVRSGHGCPNSPLSGIVHKTGLWDTAYGFDNTNFCSGWIRFKSPCCSWSTWYRMGGSKAKPAHLTAYRTEIAGSTGHIYSFPFFCTRLGSIYCINSRNAGTAPGTAIQLWQDTRAGELGNTWTFVRIAWVTSRWPFRNTGSLAGYNQAYLNYAAGDMEKDDFVNGHWHLTGRCISTLGAREYHTTSGTPYWVPTLGYCSTTKKDKFHSLIVWKRTGSKGHRMEPVALSNSLRFLTHVGCVYASPRTNCGDGDRVIDAAGVGAPYWAAFNNIRAKDPALPQGEGLKR